MAPQIDHVSTVTGSDHLPPVTRGHSLSETRQNELDHRVRIVIADQSPIFGHGVAALARQTADLVVVSVVTEAPGLSVAATAHRPDVCVLDPGLLENDHPVADAVLGDMAVLQLTDGPTFLPGRRVSRSCGVGEFFQAVRAVADPDIPFPVDRGERLDESEVALLRLFVDRGSVKEMARDTFVSESTIKRRFTDLQLKLGATNRLDAVARAARCGLL